VVAEGWCLDRQACQMWDGLREAAWRIVGKRAQAVNFAPNSASPAVLLTSGMPQLSNK